MEEIYFNFFGQLDNVESFDLLRKDSLPADFFLPRYQFAHKGDFGHALIIAGSYGKAGACILSARACMKTGCGLLTVHVPGKIYSIVQSSFPEAMAEVDDDENYFSSNINNLDRYSCVAIGPGIGTESATKKALVNLLKANASLKEPRPMVLDADALNILAGIPGFEKLLSPNSILTPHPKEFERMFGVFENYSAKVKFMQKFSARTGVVVVLKGGVTAISTPSGELFFNIKG